MEISKREFDIPVVLEPEYLASPYLDELSGMTYLSYFMKEGSPGFHATLRWVNSQLSHAPVRNFTVRRVTNNFLSSPSSIILLTFSIFDVQIYRAWLISVAFAFVIADGLERWQSTLQHREESRWTGTYVRQIGHETFVLGKQFANG